MNCPRCQSQKISEFDHEGVEFDFCSDCKGIWCDHGELAEYVETLKDIPSDLDPVKNGELTVLRCPKCPGEYLYEVNYMKGEDLLIDRCPSCSGIWLDFKELAVIQKLAVNIDAKDKLKRTIKQMKEDGFIVIES